MFNKGGDRGAALSNCQLSRGRRGIAQLFDDMYRIDLAIPLSSGKIRPDLQKMAIPAENKTRRKRYVPLTLVLDYRATPGLISKSVMHVHMTLLWTIVLGIIGSVLGGGVTHMVFRSRNDRYHPAGLIFSTLGAILILFICYKLKIHLP